MILRQEASGHNAAGQQTYDVLCDTVSDLVADRALTVGSMAYVRKIEDGQEHRLCKVADNGTTEDWEPVDAAPEEEEGT